MLNKLRISFGHVKNMKSKKDKFLTANNESYRLSAACPRVYSCPLLDLD